MKDQQSSSRKETLTDGIVLTAQDSLAQGDYRNQMYKRKYVFCGVETRDYSLPDSKLPQEIK